MDIKTKKEFEEVLKLARKYGVQTMEIAGIKFTLGELPEAPQQGSPEASAPSHIPTPDAPTDEELLFWSAGNQ